MKGIFGEPTGQPVKQVWGSQDSWDKSPEYFRQQKKKSFRKYAAQTPQDPSWGSNNAWSQPVVYGTGTYNYNSWGSPNSWNAQSSSNSVKPQATVSAVSNKMGNVWGPPPAISPNKQFASSQIKPAGNQWLQPKMWSNQENITWQQKQGNNLSEQAFFDYLKKSEIDDETICILVSQGIHSLSVLRQCTQEALAVKGISLKDVLRLKSL